MERYNSYKESGVEWMNVIPSGWNRTKMKYVGEYINGYPFKPDDWGDSGRLIIRIQNLTKGRSSENYYDGEIDEKYIIKEGDFLFSWSTTLGLYEWKGQEGVLNQHIFKVELNRELVHGYYKWVCEGVLEYLSSLSHGSTMTHLTKDVFGGIELPYPPHHEQHQIVSFLDIKTSLIDSLIEKTQRKIELLKEQRTSLINEVVTKGLNPDVGMKDSGVEWIGEIPSHWEFFKMKYGVEMINEKGLPSKGDVKISPENVESDTGICFNLFSDYSGEGMKFSKGDVLFNKLRLYLKKIIFTDYEGFSMGEMIVLRTNLSLVNRFFYYMLFNQGLIDLLDSQSTGIKLPRVSPEVILNTDIVYPPIEEQKKIVEYLDSETQLIDKTISKEEKRIELLKEYRQSLISEVVTGKIKVSGV